MNYGLNKDGNVVYMYVVIYVNMLLDYYVCSTPPLFIEMPVPSKE